MKLKILLALLFLSYIGQAQIPETFVDVKEAIPSVQLEVRYFDSNNFVGKRIDGYKAPKVFLTKQAVEALKKVQAALLKQDLSLKLFDGYRPQKAVDHFVRWAKILDDTLTKQQFYPKVPKTELFKEGYIAAKSGHTRGSTVDLTILDIKTRKELDMGSPWDMFDPISWVESDQITKQQQKNRNLLQQLMLKNGFKNYPQEWWHFTLKNEPFPGSYFDFNVE